MKKKLSLSIISQLNCVRYQAKCFQVNDTGRIQILRLWHASKYHIYLQLFAVVLHGNSLQHFDSVSIVQRKMKTGNKIWNALQPSYLSLSFNGAASRNVICDCSWEYLWSEFWFECLRIITIQFSTDKETVRQKWADTTKRLLTNCHCSFYFRLQIDLCLNKHHLDNMENA